ncbi:MAG: membrane dipeptidase [Gammaproteobacteria bacterium]|nr:membrane dipeptidase [Gammaproteobacteria bacterium]MCY4229072.1 membrane dipeptidase [Gammaproteobacteria bacterium]
MSRFLIDNLQYCNWSEKIFRQLRESEVDAIHVTVAYHQGFREMVSSLESWNRHFESYAKYILRGLTGDHVRQAKEQGKTAVFFGLQNPGPIEDDLGLVEICCQLGIRFMQLSYNNQSLLASGVHEPEDRGLTRFGREVVNEMNRVGLVVDMSHSSERSTIEAIHHSNRPIAITHANPYLWEPSVRNKSDSVLRELVQSGGMLGFSLYPNHLKNGTDCSLTGFCEMVAETVSRHGIENFGFGSDLCQDQPDEVVEWMRFGLWSKRPHKGAENAPAFPPMPNWFRDNRDWKNIRNGLQSVGFSTDEIDKIMGGNWLKFYDENFGPAP